MRVSQAAKVVLALAAVQALAVVLYLAVDAGRGRAAVDLSRLDPRPAPALTLITVEGRTAELADLRGSVVVLHFWATWCPPCREELPALLRFASTATARVVAVSLDPEWQPVLSFVEEPEVLRHVVRASSGEVAERFGVIELPQTFVIDAEGLLRLRLSGAQDWSAPALRREIEALGER